MRVEGERAGEALGRAPEQGARGRDRVLGEGERQLRDAVVELVLRGGRAHSETRWALSVQEKWMLDTACSSAAPCHKRSAFQSSRQGCCSIH